MAPRIYPEFFCTNQAYAKGTITKSYLCDKDDPEAKVFCLGHLADGYTPLCGFDLSNIQWGDVFGDGKKPKIFISANKGVGLLGMCQDFEPIEGRREELTDVGKRNSGVAI